MKKEDICYFLYPVSLDHNQQEDILELMCNYDLVLRWREEFLPFSEVKTLFKINLPLESTWSVECQYYLLREESKSWFTTSETKKGALDSCLDQIFFILSPHFPSAMPCMRNFAGYHIYSSSNPANASLDEYCANTAVLFTLS